MHTNIIKRLYQSTMNCHQSDNHTLSDQLEEGLKIESSKQHTRRCSNIKEPSVFKLNDDCLELICKQLHLTDQINFALSCQRFFNVMARRSKIEHAYVHTDKLFHWNTKTITNFFQVVGAQIKHFDVDYLPEKSLLDIFGSFCKNVEKLKICSGNLNPDSMISLIENMQSLKELEIQCINTDDNLIKYLKKFENLRHLTLTCSRYITGKHIGLLSGLESLSIHQCFKITSEHFRDFCVNLPKLRYLDILYHSILKTGDCELISKNLLELETLKLSGFEDELHYLAQLPKLKILEIQSQFDDPNFIKTLAKFRGNQLVELRVHSTKTNAEVVSAVTELNNLRVLYFDCRELKDEYVVTLARMTELEDLHLALCYDITDASVLKILEKCLKLKRLNLERCDGLTPDLLSNALKLLKEQRDRQLRTDPVVIIGTYSFYTKFARNVHLVYKYSDLLQISLEEDNGGMCSEIDDYDWDSDSEYKLIWE